MTTGHLEGAARRSGRGARGIAGVLLLALAIGQALVVAHGYAHAPARTSTPCGICLLGTQTTATRAVLPELLEPPCVRGRVEANSDTSCERPLRPAYAPRAPPISHRSSEAA